MQLGEHRLAVSLGQHALLHQALHQGLHGAAALRRRCLGRGWRHRQAESEDGSRHSEQAAADAAGITTNRHTKPLLQTVVRSATADAAQNWWMVVRAPRSAAVLERCTAAPTPRARGRRRRTSVVKDT